MATCKTIKVKVVQFLEFGKYTKSQLKPSSFRKVMVETSFKLILLTKTYQNEASETKICFISVKENEGNFT